MNFLSLLLLFIVVVMLIAIVVLIRPISKSMKKAEYSKNKMVTIVAIFSLIVLSFFTYTVIEVRSVSSGYHHSIGQFMISGLTGVEVKKRSFAVDEPVPIKFSYGHTKSSVYEEDREIMIGHKVEVYLVEFPGFGEKVILYTKEFEGVDFFTDDNQVGMSGLINIIFENNYNQNHTLDVDFSDIDFDGKIIVRLTEISYMQDSIDGVIVSTEVEDYEQSSLYFKIEGERVVFSTSR